MIRTKLGDITKMQGMDAIVNAANKGGVVIDNGAKVDGVVGQPASGNNIPASLKWTVIVGVLIMTLATVGNTAYNIWKGETAPSSVEQSVEIPNDTVLVSAPVQLPDSASVPQQ